MGVVSVYSATCRDNGKQYVGITRQLVRHRRSRHWQEARRGALTPFHCAIRKYGKAAFDVQHIASCLTWDDACEVERSLIRDMKTLVPNGYNLSPGGQGEPARFLTEERKAQMRLSLKAYWDARGRKARPKSGRVPRGTDECREMISEATRSAMAREDVRKHMQDGLKAYREANPGWREQAAQRASNQACTAETRQKMRAAKLGKKQPAEMIAKRVAKLRGQVRSPEVRAMLSKIHRQRAASKAEGLHGRA